VWQVPSHDEKPKLTEDLIRRYFEVGQNLKGEDVVNTLNHIAAERGLPLPIRSNGSEFISKIMDKWAYEPA
jgi:hypothetical protein